MNKKIRFAVIGCGHIGKRHAEMITRDEGAELVALCRSEERRVGKECRSRWSPYH